MTVMLDSITQHLLAGVGGAGRLEPRGGGLADPD
jgi:hypothetical protein